MMRSVFVLPQTVFLLQLVFLAGCNLPAVDVECQDSETAGDLGTSCDIDRGDRCRPGLKCDYGCTDDLGPCGGICRDEDDIDAFCRQGACGDVDGGCGLANECRADGYCYPEGF